LFYQIRMKKKVFGRKLSRDRGSRQALFRSLLKALILHGSIKTTKAKAKAIQPEVDRLVTLAKKGEPSARRQVYSFLANDKESVNKLFGEISEAFTDRAGGFTRITNLPRRRGDLAEVVRLEWSQKVSISEKSESKKGKKKEEPPEIKRKDIKSSLRSRVAKISKAKLKK